PQKIPSRFQSSNYDVVLLDMNFSRGERSGNEGLRWMREINEISPATSVIMMTAYAEIALAVEAVKEGAVDFIEKPWRNEKILATILSAFQFSQKQKTILALKAKQKSLNEVSNQNSHDMIGQSASMQKVFHLIKKVAATDANVLILGENGTGKELVARAIHKQSARVKGPFVKVDLGAVSGSLFESELFGYTKGAFTDAKEDKMGRFETASGGSLFLDEIGNLALPLQAKLLSALQNRSITRLGSHKVIPINIRLICATNAALVQMVKEQSFRQDLLYRINTVVIELPPLRERVEDIPLLTQHFLSLFKQKYQKPQLTISNQTLKSLSEYSWPGNIRELRHAIERAVILSEFDELLISDLVSEPIDTNALDQTQMDNYNLEEIEKWAIRKVMTKHRGNISRAAEELGLTRATLYRRMEKYGL
ncbi:MAG: sigma-54 dependent transcriptional regulator, partial [Bacteroidota bacterium]